MPLIGFALSFEDTSPRATSVPSEKAAHSVEKNTFLRVAVGMREGTFPIYKKDLSKGM